MKNILKKIIINLLTITVVFSQLPSNASYINRTKNRLVEQTVTSNSLPAFQYNRYNIELNQKHEIDLVLTLDAKIVKVQVTDATPIGLNIDKASLTEDGLKVIETPRKRSRQGKLDLIHEGLSTNKATYILNKVNNEQQTTKGIDYKTFKVTIRGILPGSYSVRAAVDGKTFASTTIVTKPEFRIDSISPSVIDLGKESLITLTGKRLDSFTQVFFQGNDIQIKEIESLEGDILKVKVFVDGNTKGGFRDLTAYSGNRL